MKYRALIGVVALSALSSFALANDAGHLATYVKKLNAAVGLDVAYSINVVGGSNNEYRVVLSKPDKARIDTPSHSYFADGKNITTYNKSKNSYYVQEQTVSALEGLLSEEKYVLWRGFFDADAFSDVVTTKDEGTRKRRGEELRIISAQFDDRGEKTYKLYISQQDGLVRQAQFLTTEGSNKSTSILTVESISTNKPIDQLFNFVTSAGATQLTIEDLRAEIIDEMVSYATAEKTMANGITFKPVQPVNIEDANRYRALLLIEFSKYPTEFVKLSKLKQIVLVEDLAVDGQHRAAVPEAKAEILYYDITFLKSELYVRGVMHHEYYHMLEEEWNGTMWYKDPKWAAFNADGFSYGTGGKNAYGQGDVSSYVHPVPGFLNWYQTYGLEEDKAVIWAVMFVPESWQKVKQIVGSDSIVRAKIDYLRKFAETKSSMMDDDFWKKVSGEGN